MRLTVLREIPKVLAISLIDCFPTWYQRLIFASVSNTITPAFLHLVMWRVYHMAGGSILDAVLPPKGVNIARCFTPDAKQTELSQDPVAY